MMVSAVIHSGSCSDSRCGCSGVVQVVVGGIVVVV